MAIAGFTNSPNTDQPPFIPTLSLSPSSNAAPEESQPWSPNCVVARHNSVVDRLNWGFCCKCVEMLKITPTSFKLCDIAKIAFLSVANLGLAFYDVARGALSLVTGMVTRVFCCYRKAAPLPVNPVPPQGIEGDKGASAPPESPEEQAPPPVQGQEPTGSLPERPNYMTEEVVRDLIRQAVSPLFDANHIHRAQLDHHTDRLDALFNSLDRHANNLNVRIDQHRDRLGDLSTGLERHGNTLGIHQQHLDEQRRLLSGTRERLDAHDKSITTMGTEVQECTTKAIGSFMQGSLASQKLDQLAHDFDKHLKIHADKSNAMSDAFANLDSTVAQSLHGLQRRLGAAEGSLTQSAPRASSSGSSSSSSGSSSSNSSAVLPGCGTGTVVMAARSSPIDSSSFSSSPPPSYPISSSSSSGSNQPEAMAPQVPPVATAAGVSPPTVTQSSLTGEALFFNPDRVPTEEEMQALATRPDAARTLIRMFSDLARGQGPKNQAN